MIDVLSECDPGFELGWEAGIRTPITGSRERCTGVSAFRSVRFGAILFATASVRLVPLRCALVQRVSLCLRPALFTLVQCSGSEEAHETWRLTAEAVLTFCRARRPTGPDYLHPPSQYPAL